MSSVKVVCTPKEADGVLVVDASNLGWRSLYAYGDLRTKDGRQSGHIFGSVRLLLSTLRNFLPSGRWCIAMAYDGHGAKQERQKVLPTYKANRDLTRFNPMPEVQGVLQAVPGTHVMGTALEGDDAMAWLAERCKTKVVILSSDKDTWALKRFPNVEICSPSLNRYVNGEDVEEKFLVTDPGKIPLSKALFGDPSDGIKGVERLQKKQVRPLLNRHTTPESLYLEFDGGGTEGMTPGTKLKLDECRQQVFDNYAVIRARTEGFTKDSVRVTKNGPKERARLVALLHQYECFALIDMLGPLFDT